MSLSRSQFAKHLQEFSEAVISTDDLMEMEEGHPARGALTQSGLPVRAFERGDVARGHCIGASCNLNRHLEAQGIYPRKITYRRGGGYSHDVTEVDVEGSPTVVDFTHRQFDDKAEFPVVEPRSDFDRRMRQRLFIPREVQRSGEGNW